MNKYRNRKIERDGIIFDSVKEWRRWCELQLLEKAGAIQNLQRQVKFELIPAQKIDGKVVERACTYVADFSYMKPIGGNDFLLCVEDTKGVKTKDYIIKRKLMLFRYGIKIIEI